MKDKALHYFKNTDQWRDWLHVNHLQKESVELVFYRIDNPNQSMRWEDAVQVAICYGWIDSTVRKLDSERRKQVFSPRKDKSVWSKVNKKYVESLIANNLMHESGLKKIETAKQNGSWESLDAVENLEIPEDLMFAFNNNFIAYQNYKNFSPSYRKNYLYWLNQAKRLETRTIRINQIIEYCNKNIKSRN